MNVQQQQLVDRAMAAFTEMADPLEEEFKADEKKQKGAAAVIASAQPEILAGDGHDHHDEMAGALTTSIDLRRFLLAGHAIVTVKSRKTGSRFTFKFSRPDEEPNQPRERPIWVRVLSGADNNSDYAYLGTVWIDAQGIWAYRHGRKSRVAENAPSVAAAKWFIAILQRDPAKLFETAEIWHEGRCGRCGRRLTVPESISTGFGPECAGKVGL